MNCKSTNHDLVFSGFPLNGGTTDDNNEITGLDMFSVYFNKTLFDGICEETNNIVLVFPIPIKHTMSFFFF